MASTQVNDTERTEGRLGCMCPFRTSETCGSVYQLPVIFHVLAEVVKIYCISNLFCFKTFSIGIEKYSKLSLDDF